jgi:hypothetical protein
MTPHVRLIMPVVAMKKNKTLINELREELRYHQTMVRVDIRALRAGIRRCKEIGAAMRELQPKPKRHLTPRTADWRPAPFDDAFSQPDLLTVIEAESAPSANR